MKLDSFGMRSLLYFALLFSLAVTQPLDLPSINNTLPTTIKDDFDLWIAGGWDRVMADLSSKDPQPFLITMVKERNPYKLVASISFTYNNPEGKDGIIFFERDHWIPPFINQNRSPYINIQPFEWENKPMSVDQAIGEVMAQTWLGPVQREMNFDDLTAKVSYGDEGLMNGLLIYRFERKGVYVIFVEMVSKRVTLGRVVREGGSNGTVGSGGGCEGVGGTCLDHLDVVA